MTVAVGEGADGPGATASTMQDSTRKRRTTTKKKKKVITKRGLHRSQIEADALDDEEYWDRFLTEDSSIVPTPPPTRRPTPNPTPPPTPGPTPPPTPGPTPGPTPPPTPGPTPAPTPGPTLAPTPRPTTAAPTTPAPTFTCNFSPEDRAIAIADILRQVSNPIDFVAPFSPQSRSLKWITEDDSLYLCPDDPFLIQRYTMAVFYFSTDGPNWVECSAPADLSDPNSIREANANCNLEVEIGQGGTDAWLTPVSECQWGGVACDTVSSDMERIEFGKLHLTRGKFGQICQFHHHISNSKCGSCVLLADLTRIFCLSLSIEKNNLAGTIPRELQELQELRFLHMEEGRTGGTIPPELGNLSNLLELDMNFNALTGSIPANMYNLANLLEFDMNDNSLSGPISPDIQKMTKLTFLQFHRNQFTGSIPAEVGNLNRLSESTLFYVCLLKFNARFIK